MGRGENANQEAEQSSVTTGACGQGLLEAKGCDSCVLSDPSLNWEHISLGKMVSFRRLQVFKRVILKLYFRVSMAGTQ